MSIEGYFSCQERPVFEGPGFAVDFVDLRIQFTGGDMHQFIQRGEMVDGVFRPSARMLPGTATDPRWYFGSLKDGFSSFRQEDSQHIDLRYQSWVMSGKPEQITLPQSRIVSFSRMLVIAAGDSK